MEADIQQRLEQLEKKLDAVYLSVEKTRKYFLWTLIGTIVMFVLPFIGLAFALPSFLSYYSSMGSMSF